MKRSWLFFLLVILYMESVYHLAVFGLKPMNLLLLLPAAVCLSGFQALVTDLLPGAGKKIMGWLFLVFHFLLFFVQLVYIKIFSQPLLLDAIINAGDSALTDFGAEAVRGVLSCAGFGILMAVPFAAFGLLLHKEGFKKRWIESLICAVTGLIVSIVLLAAGYHGKWAVYEEYQSYYDPSVIVCKYGVIPSVERDLLGDVLPAASSALEALLPADKEEEEASEAELPEEEFLAENVSEEGTEDVSPNVLEVDFDQLRTNAETELMQQLASYMEAAEPTNKNEYTGMFEGYNLIYMTAEGFSQYAIHETLTPTLYQMANTGFVAENYYVPLWQTSTSDGEYVNLTGLIPDQQFSMRRTSENEQPYSLPAFFAKEGVKSYAYHNNSLSYYDRYLTHPNMGYDFKAAKSGKLSDAEWSSQLFEMENANLWPSSDLDMIRATLPEYIKEERFHAYYMTISGHLEYSFAGNDMSELHQEEVADLPYNEVNKAYIACNMELDRALEYLIQELKAAGQLEKTVIAISSDHYPYGLEVSDLEEMAGYELEGSLDLYRNSLILWNSEMEPVTIEKPCSAIDLLPTLYNLFGFEYDSRLYAGKDMLSDSEAMVVFANQSFITDTMSYNSEKREIVMADGSEADEEAFAAMQQKVKGLFEYSAGILDEDFYKYVKAAEKTAEPQELQSEMEVHFLDVGQGLAVYANCDGHHLIYDGGDRGTSSFVVAYLKKLGVEKLDYVISSHYDTDHLAGLIGCLNVFETEQLICSDYVHDSKLYQSFTETTEELGLEGQHPKVGETYMLGDAVITILAPSQIDAENSNNNSVAVKLTHGDNTFIFTGDAEYQSEEAMCRSGINLSCDVLVLGHHGSASSTTWEFLQKTVPEYAVISCGADNSYGHPHEETMEKIQAMELAIYRTDQQGTISVLSDGKSLEWSQKPCA